MVRTTSLGLILASGSPARRELLGRLDIPFTVRPANIDEPTSGFSDPRTFVQTVAWLKAAHTASQIDSGLILAADTIGWLDGEPILKPVDEADARRILTRQGGRVHELWTGVVLWRRPDNLQLTWQERSDVEFRKLTEEELTVYLATRSWMGSSGAYNIQEEGDPYVRVLTGSITNVIGLPLESLERALSGFERLPNLPSP
jgi:septum formation protein